MKLWCVGDGTQTAWSALFTKKRPDVLRDVFAWAGRGHTVPGPKLSDIVTLLQTGDGEVCI